MLPWYFYTDISAGSSGNFGGKTGRTSDCLVCAFLKNRARASTKFVQFVQKKHCKKAVGVPTIDRNAEILSEGFNGRFSRY